MAERSLRGMSIGAKSLESDDNVDFAARVEVAPHHPAVRRVRGSSERMGVPLRRHRAP